MIKVSTRHNLIYVVLTIASTNIRRIVKTIIGSVYGLSNSIFYTVIMFIGEMFTGIIVNQYHKIVLPERKKIMDPSASIVVKRIDSLQKVKDSKLKIYSLFIMLGFLDFFEFTVSVFYISKFPGVSGSLESRVYGIVILFSALLHYFVLKFRILKHQLFSLLIIGICLITVIVAEIIIEKDNIFLSTSDYILLIFLLLLEEFSISLILAGEQYLMEFDSLTPHELLIYEGFFGLIVSFIGLINENPLEKLQNAYNSVNTGLFVLFIFLLILYVILSGLFNIYRLHTNKLYSPMAVTLSNYCINPFFMIYDYVSGGDFIIKGEKNTAYFLVNFITSIIIAITGFVFNDFLVVFCCGLERDTYEQISRRSQSVESINLNELKNIIPEDEDDDKAKVYNVYV